MSRQSLVVLVGALTVVLIALNLDPAFGQGDPKGKSKVLPTASANLSRVAKAHVFAGVDTRCPYRPQDHFGLSKRYLHEHKLVSKEAGSSSAGRNIVCQGFRTKRGVRVAKTGEVKLSLAKLESVYAASVAPVPTASAPSAGAVSGSTPADLAGIAQCESGGNPTAVSPDGQYRGKYQFDRSTWASIGGTGDPAAAPESTQDQLAGQLHRERGGAPWPNCA